MSEQEKVRPDNCQACGKPPVKYKPLAPVHIADETYYVCGKEPLDGYSEALPMAGCLGRLLSSGRTLNEEEKQYHHSARDRRRVTRVCGACGDRIRRTIGVCDACRAKIDSADAAASQDVGVRVDMSAAFYSNRGLNHVDSERLTALIEAVASRDLLAPVGRVSACFAPGSSQSGRTYGVSFPVPIDRVEALGELCELIHKAANVAYAHGHRDGRNVLGSLADGSITLDEVNAKAARAEDIRRRT